MFQLTDIKMVREQRTILDIPELSIPTDRLTVILGHNGSGKSSLVSLLAGQNAPDSGNIAFHGRPLSALNHRQLAQKIAFLPQKLPAAAGLNVKEVIRLGRFPWRGLLGRWNAQDERVIDAALARTGTSTFANQTADQLSGGERQRVWIAMLLAQESPLLILDEPTSALDIHHQFQLMNLLSELARESAQGIIVILHDLNLALQYADHVIALQHGSVALSGDAHLLLDERRLSDLYNTPIRLLEHPNSTDSHPTKVAVVCP